MRVECGVEIPACKTKRLVTYGFFVQVLFDRHFRQRSSIITLVTSDTPFFHPLILDVRLTALRTHEHALLIQDSPLLFHRTLRSIETQSRIAQDHSLLQAYGRLFRTRPPTLLSLGLTPLLPMVRMPA